MQEVGIRELKAKLSHYLRVAKTGGGVLVTEHGKVIAALGPPAMADLPPELAGLRTLVARGIATPGRPKRPGSYPQTHPQTGLQRPAGTSQRVIDELRDDRLEMDARVRRNAVRLAIAVRPE